LCRKSSLTREILECAFASASLAFRRLFVVLSRLRESLPLFCHSPRIKIEYLHKHRHRLVNYELLPTHYQISIGSGTVESAIKQLDRRLKLSGSQWNSNSVNKTLCLRCAYLNGQLAV
jgi:hypothetical protein